MNRVWRIRISILCGDENICHLGFLLLVLSCTLACYYKGSTAHSASDIGNIGSASGYFIGSQNLNSDSAHILCQISASKNTSDRIAAAYQILRRITVSVFCKSSLCGDPAQRLHRSACQASHSVIAGNLYISYCHILHNAHIVANAASILTHAGLNRNIFKGYVPDRTLVHTY